MAGIRWQALEHMYHLLVPHFPEEESEPAKATESGGARQFNSKLTALNHKTNSSTPTKRL